MTPLAACSQRAAGHWRAAALLCLALIAGEPAAAAGAGHREAARTFLALTEAEARIAAALSELKARQLDALEKWYIPAERRAQGIELIERLGQLLERELSWERMEDDVVELYTKVFSEDELRALSAFYRTPLGRTYLEKQKLLTRHTVSLTERRLRGMLPQLESVIQSLGSEEPGSRADLGYE